MQGVDFERFEFFGGEDDDAIAIAVGEPTLGGAQRGGPGRCVADLRIDGSAEAEGGDDVAERAIEDGLGEEDGAGEAASFVGDLPVEANAVDEASEEKRGNDAGAGAIGIRCGA